MFDAITSAGILASMMVESALGLVHVSHRAARETQSDWLLFVNGGNELAVDYIISGVDFASAHPDAGCFGGKLLLLADLRRPFAAQPF